MFLGVAKTYCGYIRQWIRPRWGSHTLDEITAVEVEAWLRGLNLACASRAKVRNVLSVLYNHACRYEFFDRNPMRFVRQSAERRRAPDVLTGAEIKMLVDNLPLRERTLVLLAASTGLRQSELFGLKWRDVDFEHGELNVIRSIVCGIEGRCKTESSQKPIPMHPQLAASLNEWRRHCRFESFDDWAFASSLRGGRKPDGGDYAPRYPACRSNIRYSKTNRVAHISPHLLHSATKPRSRVQGDAGGGEAFLIAIHARCVYASGWPRQACGAGCSALSFYSTS